MSINLHVRVYYAKFRKSGMKPSHALSAARTLEKFQGYEREGLVKLEAHEDQEMYDPGDSEPECPWHSASNSWRYAPSWLRNKKDPSWNAKGNEECPRCRIQRAFWGTIENLGVYGIIGSYRLEEDAKWNHGDSIWGCSGYERPTDPFENWYVVDVMSATIGRLEEELPEGDEYVSDLLANTGGQIR